MKAQIIQLEHLQFPKVWFYTIQVEGKPLSEFKDFQQRMQLDAKDKSQAAEINRYIKQIGKYYGAQDRYFKREGHAERLPPPTHRFFDSDGESDFGLRLYCIRISEKIVILLNGDRKTSQRVQNCANCKPHFDFANTLSDLIFEAEKRDLLEYDSFDILLDEDFEFSF